MACDKSRPLSCRRRHDSAVIRDSQQQSQRLHGMGVDTRTLKKANKFTTANREDRIWQPPAKTRAVSNKKSKLEIVLISTFREPAANHHVGWGWSKVVFKVKSLVCNLDISARCWDSELVLLSDRLKQTNNKKRLKDGGCNSADYIMAMTKERK